MANELVVVNQNQVAVAGDSPKSTKTRAQLLQCLPGIVDDPSKSLAAVIKGHLKEGGMTNTQANAEYQRILREDLHGAVLAKIEWAKANGYALEYKSMKDTKAGQEKFSVAFIPPKVAKRLTQSEQDKMFALLGGKDSAMGKQVWEQLQKSGMLAQPKTVTVETTQVS